MLIFLPIYFIFFTKNYNSKNYLQIEIIPSCCTSTFVKITNNNDNNKSRSSTISRIFISNNNKSNIEIHSQIERTRFSSIYQRIQQRSRPFNNALNSSRIQDPVGKKRITNPLQRATTDLHLRFPRRFQYFLAIISSFLSSLE